MENTENRSTSEKIKETPESNELHANSSPKGESVSSLEKSSEITQLEISEEKVEESQLDDDQPRNNGDNVENADNEERNNSGRENDENTEAMEKNCKETLAEIAASSTQDEAGRETSANSVPPPKPPRLKSASVEDTDNEKQSSDRNIDGEAGKEEGEEENTSPKPFVGKPMSVASKNSRETVTVEAIEDSIEKVEKDGHTEQKEKGEVDGTHDDADVIQSPAPRTGW